MFLNGVDVSEVTDKIMTRNVLVDLVRNQDLVARVIHEIPFISVDLFNTSGSSEINIAMEFERITNIPLVRKKVLCCYQPGSYVPG